MSKSRNESRNFCPGRPSNAGGYAVAGLAGDHHSTAGAETAAGFISPDDPCCSKSAACNCETDLIDGFAFVSFADLSSMKTAYVERVAEIEKLNRQETSGSCSPCAPLPKSCRKLKKRLKEKLKLAKNGQESFASLSLVDRTTPVDEMFYENGASDQKLDHGENAAGVGGGYGGQSERGDVAASGGYAAVDDGAFELRRPPREKIPAAVSNNNNSIDKAAMDRTKSSPDTTKPFVNSAEPVQAHVEYMASSSEETYVFCQTNVGQATPNVKDTNFADKLGSANSQANKQLNVETGDAGANILATVIPKKSMKLKNEQKTEKRRRSLGNIEICSGDMLSRHYPDSGQNNVLANISLKNNSSAYNKDYCNKQYAVKVEINALDTHANFSDGTPAKVPKFRADNAMLKRGPTTDQKIRVGSTPTGIAASPMAASGSITNGTPNLALVQRNLQKPNVTPGVSPQNPNLSFNGRPDLTPEKPPSSREGSLHVGSTPNSQTKAPPVLSPVDAQQIAPSSTKIAPQFSMPPGVGASLEFSTADKQQLQYAAARQAQSLATHFAPFLPPSMLATPAMPNNGLLNMPFANGTGRLPFLSLDCPAVNTFNPSSVLLPTRKKGRWCALHVQIAWDILNKCKQRKEKNASTPATDQPLNQNIAWQAANWHSKPEKAALCSQASTSTESTVLATLQNQQRIGGKISHSHNAQQNAPKSTSHHHHHHQHRDKISSSSHNQHSRRSHEERIKDREKRMSPNGQTTYHQNNTTQNRQHQVHNGLPDPLRAPTSSSSSLNRHNQHHQQLQALASSEGHVRNQPPQMAPATGGVGGGKFATGGGDHAHKSSPAQHPQLTDNQTASGLQAALAAQQMAAAAAWQNCLLPLTSSTGVLPFGGSLSFGGPLAPNSFVDSQAGGHPGLGLLPTSNSSTFDLLLSRIRGATGASNQSGAPNNPAAPTGLLNGLAGGGTTPVFPLSYNGNPIAPGDLHSQHQQTLFALYSNYLMDQQHRTRYQQHLGLSGLDPLGQTAQTMGSAPHLPFGLAPSNANDYLSRLILTTCQQQQMQRTGQQGLGAGGLLDPTTREAFARLAALNPAGNQALANAGQLLDTSNSASNFNLLAQAAVVVQLQQEAHNQQTLGGSGPGSRPGNPKLQGSPFSASLQQMAHHNNSRDMTTNPVTNGGQATLNMHNR